MCSLAVVWLVGEHIFYIHYRECSFIQPFLTPTCLFLSLSPLPLRVYMHAHVPTHTHTHQFIVSKLLYLLERTVGSDGSCVDL